MVVVLKKDGWNYIVWGVSVNFQIRVARTLVPRMRKVSFGFYPQDAIGVMDPTSPSNLGVFNIGSFETTPWGGFQVNGHVGEEVGFTYIST
jgi:hypothetical protein